MNLDVKSQKSIAGLRANVAAFLINLSFFIPGFNIFFPILALIIEENNNFVREYSKQTLIVSIFFTVSSLTLLIAYIGTYVAAILMTLICIIQVISIILSILGKEFKIPFIDTIKDFFFVD